MHFYWLGFNYCKELLGKEEIIFERPVKLFLSPFCCMGVNLSIFI